MNHDQDMGPDLFMFDLLFLNIMFRALIISLLFIFAGQQINADVLVRMEVQQDAVISNVDIRLFEDVAPLTVANFLNYVNDGDYTHSFIHRATDVNISVIQGGGYTFDPALNDGTFSYDKINDIYPGGLQEVPAAPPVQNEFNLSNVRGTIAMAKQAGDEDSATSQWFINVTDNSASLDVLEGGYTVFGKVLSNGMTVVDQIFGQTRYDRTDIHPAFAELPLINYTADPITQANLVRTHSVTPLLSISADIDFRTVLINTSVQSVVTIRNIDTVAHSIGDIATTDTVDAPFSIMTNTCVDPLNQDEECTLEIQFSPLTENVFNDTFNIELTDLGLSYSFALTGAGVLTPQNISLSQDVIAFGDSLLLDLIIGFPAQIVLTVTNDGEVDLYSSSVTLGGADVADFELIDNCTPFSPVVPAGNCLVGINFKPLTTGDKSATLTLVSDDPDESLLVLPITGTASTDTDGIPASVEDAGYNDGDGNNDGVPDSIQNHVASFPAANGKYITLLVTPGARINDLSVLTEDQVGTPPDNIRFNLGLLDFRIDGLFPGAAVEVGFIVPPGYVPSTYYMYGPTPDNTNPHWYEFMFDGTTGAEFLGNAIIPSPDGGNIERNLVRVIFEDGERGDADLTVNGVIVDPGAPVVALDDADSGSMGVLVLLVPALVVLFRGVSAYSSCRKYRPQV